MLVRSYDRAHALQLVHEGVDYQVRETFESALLFGEAALRAVGVADEEAAELRATIRIRDQARFEMQLAEGIGAGRDLLHSNLPKPTPLTTPQREAKLIGPDNVSLPPSSDVPPPPGEPPDPSAPPGSV